MYPPTCPSAASIVATMEIFLCWGRSETESVARILTTRARERASQTMILLRRAEERLFEADSHPGTRLVTALEWAAVILARSR
jgi:hypothetical protein